MKLFSKIYIVILLHAAFISTIIFFLEPYGIIPHIIQGPICVVFWFFIHSKIKLEDNSTHYLVALLYSSMAITIASLSFDEINSIMKVSTFEDYFWNKIVLNLLGWANLPLAITELIKIAKSETNTKKDS
ncbi:hypothetical protein [Rodentibacter caecimuris]|uniref:hypothetical protein n=1 Tax=Rodentibacter caecimuris TaxID=1796644 RepID=UPI0013A096F5|nr:hypothetical protein [Rodentibacter heylii]QIA76159.1 hypothetical protein FEE42_01715 [Rodentibacter heylii]